MYLGNLNHASNPEMLREIGIGRILSVGEPLAWAGQGPNAKQSYRDYNPDDNCPLESELEYDLRQRGWERNDFLYIDCVQDNGVDPLTDQFHRCLRFIEQAKKDGTATLVHCRVGVSRSATICIAEVMKELGLSFPRAYTFVRARRLNVIIQPHLRFVYELLKWEEHQRTVRGLPLRRELEWQTVAREIALMNKPYSRQ
jgi:dual specificity MAP kinase phosphatase